MKMKEIGPRGGGTSLAPLLDPSVQNLLDRGATPIIDFNVFRYFIQFIDMIPEVKC